VSALAASGLPQLHRAEAYLPALTLRLAAGLSGLEPERAARHRDFLHGCQRDDGGFSGRASGSDLYYTSFAVRALFLLGGLSRPLCDSVADYLKRRITRRAETSRPVALIDHLSWLYAVSVIALASGGRAPDGFGVEAAELPATFESFRSGDGGYARTHAAGSGSTYHTFLVAVGYELLGRRPPDTDAMVDFALSRRRADGGFVEIAPMRRSGTNPTAAAAALLVRYGRMAADVRAGIGRFLTDARDPQGGFRANLRVPAADLLSTFAGVVTAEALALDEVVGRDTTARFVSSLERRDGGYVGGVWDDVADPEYTFYGLGLLALLRGQHGGG
jgi:geranylgeranyl transferase type-2 subunit beta